MEQKHIFEGKTTNEAIEKGLKELKVTKEQVEIKVLENEDKRSFFSILAPRIVKVEIKIKGENKKEIKREGKQKREIKDIDFDKAKQNVDNFLNKWIEKLPSSNIKYNLSTEEQYLTIDMNGEDIHYLIGYRGEVLNHLQDILSVIASKGLDYKVKVILNIEGYKEKRKKALEELAVKLSKTVIKTRKSVTLEPMTAYERKVIHTKLQDSNKVQTTSVGEEPYRKIVISLK